MYVVGIFFFFFTFYIAFFVHPSHLSLYYICTVQRVHINYQNKSAQMSFFPAENLSCIKVTHINNLQWGKYLDLFNFESTIPVSEAQGCKQLFGYHWCVRPPASPSPTIGLYGISLADLRDVISDSSFVQKYFIIFFFSPHLKGKFG